MDDLISRQTAIEAIRAMQTYKLFAGDDQILVDQAEAQTELMLLPSAQPERRVFKEMSDTEFEKWLHEHGICNPDIHESIPCDVVPSLIDFAINELPPTEPRWIPVTERLPEYMEPVLTWDGSTYCVEKRIPVIRDNDTDEGIPGEWWVSDDYDWYDSNYYPNLRDGACIAWMPLPEPYREEEQDETD